MRVIVSILAGAVAIGASSVGMADSKVANEVFDFEHVSCNGKPNEIRVVIDNLDKSIGLVTVDLYENNNETFLRRAGRVGRTRAAAKAPRTSVCVKAPSSGSFAIAVYHDKNANKTFDKGPFGLPAEPWGISNNPKIRLAPPKVEQALIDVGKDGAGTLIKLKD